MLRGVAQGRPGSVLGSVDERDQVARATRLYRTKTKDCAWRKQTLAGRHSRSVESSPCGIVLPEDVTLAYSRSHVGPRGSRKQASSRWIPFVARPLPGSERITRNSHYKLPEQDLLLAPRFSTTIDAAMLRR